MTVSTAAVVVCLPRTRHLSAPFLSLFLRVWFAFRIFPKPCQGKANAADAFFSARNKIDPGKSRLEINLTRPARAAGGTWVGAVVWQVNQPKKSQEPSDSCLAPLPRLALALPCLALPHASSAKVRIILACRQRALAKCNIECIPPSTPRPGYSHTTRTTLNAQNCSRKEIQQKIQQKRVHCSNNNSNSRRTPRDFQLKGIAALCGFCAY